MSNRPEELRVKTNAGDIVAYKNTDPENPGICLMFCPRGETVEIDICNVEVPNEIDDPKADKSDNASAIEKDTTNDDIVNVYVYEDVWSDDFTRKFQISREETLDAIDQ